MDSAKLEALISYKFKNKNLLQEALTHRSYINENPKWKIPHNERLEFLGDAVLELAVTEALFNKFPDEPEGKLTTLRAALVNYQILAKISKKVNLEKFLLMSRGEAKDTGRAREVILANAFESLIGAMYLDSDYTTVRDLVVKIVFSEIDEVVTGGLDKDPKSLLQEYTQANLKVTPSYKLFSQNGPDHKKIFVVGVYFGDKEIARGEGLSKQEAEVAAAQKALEVYKF